MNESNKSSAEIGVEIDEQEKQISTMLEAYQKVEQEILLLQRQILELQLQKKDFEMAKSKGGHNIKQANIELKLLKSKFWQAKNQGL